MVVALFPIIFPQLTNQAEAQSNNRLKFVFYETAELHKFILYKDDERTRIAEEIYRFERLIGHHGGSCVQFARRFFPNLPSLGQAKNLKTNLTEPQVGALVKTKESSYGHLGYVLYIQDGEILIVESNWDWRETIGMRWLNIDDPNIVGYFVP